MEADKANINNIFSLSLSLSREQILLAHAKTPKNLNINRYHTFARIISLKLTITSSRSVVAVIAALGVAKYFDSTSSVLVSSKSADSSTFTLRLAFFFFRRAFTSLVFKRKKA